MEIETVVLFIDLCGNGVAFEATTRSIMREKAKVVQP